MNAAIATRRLTKCYGPNPAVVDLDLEVARGEVFGFLGPNGAGKTTTIRMLLALQRPSRGQAAVLGLDPRADGPELHRRVGYLPGELELYGRLTGHQHIRWFARARGTPYLPMAGELVERFAVVTDRPVRELSKGNRQKIGLVLAFMHRPELLVLDEPSSGLDPLVRHEFELLVREIVDEGGTVFLSSHELDEVQRCADRVGIIRSGRLVATDSVDGLRRRAPRKIEAWLTRPTEAAAFAAIDGVSVTSADEHHLVLDVPPVAIGAVLRLIADHDPVDVVARPPDLDELFLDFYRAAPEERRHGR